MGYQVVPEAARTYIEEQTSAGKVPGEIVEDQLTFQRIILNRMLETEHFLDRKKLTFFDRALPDGIGYFRYAGLDPKEVTHLCHSHGYRYHKIFFFDPIPSDNSISDDLRRENEAQAQVLGKEIRRGYLELDYQPIVIPVLPLEERVALVLHHVSDLL